MAISLTDVNPQTYSNLGEVWLSVSGTGFQDPLNSITGVTAYCSDNNIPFSLPSGHRHILSDSLMIILAPSAADLQVNAKLATLNEYTSDVTIEVLYDLLDDFGNVATPNQIASWQVYCKWLPGVQSITIPNILWMNGSVPGTVTSEVYSLRVASFAFTCRSAAEGAKIIMRLSESMCRCPDGSEKGILLSLQYAVTPVILFRGSWKPVPETLSQTSPKFE